MWVGQSHQHHTVLATVLQWLPKASAEGSLLAIGFRFPGVATPAPRLRHSTVAFPSNRSPSTTSSPLAGLPTSRLHSLEPYSSAPAPLQVSISKPLLPGPFLTTPCPCNPRHMLPFLHLSYSQQLVPQRRSSGLSLWYLQGFQTWRLQLNCYTHSEYVGEYQGDLRVLVQVQLHCGPDLPCLTEGLGWLPVSPSFP